MRLASILMRLPHTLLVTSLALAAAALPVESSSVELLVLTPDNFNETTSHGVWFIEYFSPYCRHCQKFAPTWTELAEENQKSENPGIRLAQVNCAVHGDLCRENGVDGYPQMNVYKYGKYMETFNQVRDPAIIRKFLSEHAEPPLASAAPAVPTTTAAIQPAQTHVSYDTILPPVSDRLLNPTGTVLSLNEKTFFDTISHGHVFVKFFAPWCGHCKKLAPSWTELARHMKDKLTIAEVNCEDHGALCRTQDVSGYPMLFYYSGNKKDSKTEYTGSRKLEQLKAFAEKLIGPPVQELKPEDLDRVINEHPVVYLLLHPASDAKALEMVVENSKILFGSPPIYVSSSPRLFQHFSLDSSRPYLLALKDNDSGVPVTIYEFHWSTAADDKEILRHWLLSNRLPISMELDSDTFQEVMNAPNKPLVVIAATSEANLPEIIERLKDVAKRWRANKGATNVVFTWMNSDKWTKWLKIYYDSDQYGGKIQLSPASISSALYGAITGTMPYKHSENVIERFARYVNQKLMSLEQLIAHHPWRFVFAVVSILALVVLFIKRLVWDETMDDYYRGRGGDKLTRKSARLD
ncbi:unnamed protein product [Somion occarium]|uniref:Thioredoxin domain-containing protein n=1 Tax=Somion occarium TaxID=3059160 RepID=A0ABP1DQW6_9APHY